jgi:hypothetical protein
LQAAVNGDRVHPATLHSPEEIAAEAKAMAGRYVRAMVEPLDADPSNAVAYAEAIESTLHEAGVTLEQVHHGDGIASWAVNQRAVGHGIRTGLEDTPVLPGGRQTTGNGDLIAAAAAMQCRGS